MKERLLPTKEGLPREAFAIAGVADSPDTWKLSHHRRSIFRALKGSFEIELTVDWDKTDAAAAALSPRNRRRRVAASPEEILEAAAHLAEHYRKADKPLPDVLAALV